MSLNFYMIFKLLKRLDFQKTLTETKKAGHWILKTDVARDSLAENLSNETFVKGYKIYLQITVFKDR